MKTQKNFLWLESYDDFIVSSIGQRELREYREIFPKSKRTDDEVLRPIYEKHVAYKCRIGKMSIDELEAREFIYGGFYYV